MNRVFVVQPMATWHQLRGSVTADDTPLATFDYASWPSSNTFDIEARLKHCQNLLIAFFGTNAANEAANYILYGIQKNGPIHHLVNGVVTLGARVTTTHPISGAAGTKYWADTITTVNGIFTDVDVLLDAAGNDRIGILEIPRRNLKELYLEIDVDTVESIEAIVSGY